MRVKSVDTTNPFRALGCDGGSAAALKGDGSARLGAEGDWMRMRCGVLIADPHRFAVGLDPEKDKGQPHQQHAKGKK